MRPKLLNEIIGNEDVKKCLKINIEASKKRNTPIPHILIQGPSGCGKTTLALCIGREINKKTYMINGAALTSNKELIKLFMKVKEGEIVFIDEIHRVPSKIAEFLYTIMEDFQMILKGCINVKPFTMIGATVDVGLLPAPFVSRFKFQYFVKEYSKTEIKEILSVNAQKLGLKIAENGIQEIVNRSKNIPRVAISRLLWINDYKTAKKIDSISVSDIKNAFSLKNIDDSGLDENDRKYIDVLSTYKEPLGLKAISSITGLSEDTITSYIEPYLISTGKIQRTKSGRILAGTNEPDISDLFKEIL